MASGDEQAARGQAVAQFAVDRPQAFRREAGAGFREIVRLLSANSKR